MNSRVHPKYKTRCRVANWPEYERGLVQRGARGGQRNLSDLAIETALTLRLVFHLPLRQTEGFLNSVFRMMDVDLVAPDPGPTSELVDLFLWECYPPPPGRPSSALSFQASPSLLRPKRPAVTGAEPMCPGDSRLSAASKLGAWFRPA